ncbi:MAG TPA: glycosyltransferase family 1 protein, partial [Anaerolineales bacterium]|nr:glycosyltransferase family 1 protein [Anaerolineales bacterium]
MHILLIHNHYTQPGGEDAVFRAEADLLRSRGHEVVEFVENNRRLQGINPWKTAMGAVWSREAYRRIKRLIREARPDVAHFHNTFLRISPAAYYACKEEGVPVVQTLHNYRLICPGALLMRDGQVCEACLGKPVPWPGVVHGCWRGSRAQTAVVAGMLTVHRLMRTWTEQVDLYIALTEFARRKFIEGGLPAEKIVVKPNFVMSDELRVMRDKIPITHHSSPFTRHFALFVGRLSPEKGIRTLLRAWQTLKDMPLKLVGDGPLMEEVQAQIAREGWTHVEVLGRKPREEVFRLMQEARALVFPSEWYEGFPMTIAEAFACGLPVIASRLGAMAEIVEDGRTGLLFEPGNPENLAEKVAWAWTHPKEMEEMGREARREYEAKYT